MIDIISILFIDLLLILALFYKKILALFYVHYDMPIQPP